MTKAERTRACRDMLRAEGLCAWCAKPNDRAVSYCSACSEAAEERRRARKVARAIAGLCRSCDRPAAPGMASCEMHAERDRARGDEKRRRARKPRFHCSLCGNPGHYRVSCTEARCECGATKDPRDVACASCVQLDFWRGKPVLELLHERGPTDVYDIAARLGKKPTAVVASLCRYEKRGVVEAMRGAPGERTIWRLAA